MKELYVLAWHSYDMNSTELDGNIIGVYESLAEAQHEMNESIEETEGLCEGTAYTIEKHDIYMKFTTPYGYAITYYVSINPKALP